MKVFTRFSLILVAVLATMVVVGQPAQAQVTNPQQGAIGIEGVIPTEPPSQAPTISTPGGGQTFQENPVVVRGICLPDLEVRIYKNDVFTGSVVCGVDGSYEISIDIFVGPNVLIARQFDSLSQSSPDSNSVTVTFDPPGNDDGFEQLILSSNFSSRGTNPGETLVWPLAISGGLGPYALSVDWGDGTVGPVSLNSAGEFEIDHAYAEPGVYKLIVRATDSRDKTAFIQLTVVVNGPVDNVSTVNEAGGGAGGAAGEGGEGAGGIQTTNRTVIVWPVYLLLFFVFSTFWIGRRYERRRIKELLYNRQSIKF